MKKIYTLFIIAFIFLVTPNISFASSGVLSTKTDYPTGSIPVGVTISPDGTSVYVANAADNTVTMYSRSTTTGAISAKTTDYPTGLWPVGVTISPDGTSVYVTNENSKTVSMYSRNTNGTLSAKTDYTTGGMAPVGVIVSPDGTSVYVTNYVSSTVSMYSRDTTTGALTALATPTIATGSTPQGVTISPDGTSVYVTNAGAGANTVSMFTRNTNGTLSAKTDYPIGYTPQGVTISPDGTSVYATNSNTVSMFTRNTNGTLSAKTDYPTGYTPQGVTISPDGTSVYATNYSSNTVSMFTRNTNGTLSAKTDYPTGLQPTSVTISPDGTSVYVTNENSNSVSMFIRGAAPTDSISVFSKIFASWTITGPTTITGSGTSQSYLSEPAGTYTITFNPVAGYYTPTTQSLTLTTGKTISFNGNYIANCGALTDVDGNTYTTVVIGTQCWMADNLRTTRTPGGTSLTEGSGMYSSGPSGSGSPWGRLYDWTTAMNGAPAATAVGAKIQGICPTGWHIPSDYNQDPNDDWQTLSNFLGGNSVSGGKMKRTEVSLYWNQTTGGPYGDNSSGFSGVAAGFWQYGMYHNTGYYAFFLSSSEYSATYHTIQSKVLFGNGTAFTGSNNNPETIGDSVRCIKDGAIFSYTVSTTAGTGGTISPASQTVTSGNTTTFTVTPNAGYTASVSGCSGSLSGTTYTTGAITGACTVSATFTPPASCTVTTKSNCSLPATASGSSAGNCSSGYSGSCNYLCTNGAWNQNSNLCTPSTCTLPWGNVIASGVSVPAFQALSVISPATCASKTLTCNNGGNLSGGNYQYSNCTVLQPSATISANPTRVKSGGTSRITWTLSNTSCTAKRNGVPWTPGPGFSSSNSYLDTITGQTVYIITCTGVTPQSVTVNVLAGFQEF